jgi:hypothetical protein
MQVVIPEFLGIPCIYGDVGKTEFRNRRDLIPGAELIPECVTSRNRMCSLTEMVFDVSKKFLIFEKITFLVIFFEKNTEIFLKIQTGPVKKSCFDRPVNCPVRNLLPDRAGPAGCRHRLQLWRKANLKNRNVQ